MRDFLVFLLPLVRGQNITLQNVVLYFLQLRAPLHLHEHLQVLQQRPFLNDAFLIRQGELLLCLHNSKMEISAANAAPVNKVANNSLRDDELSGAVQLTDRAYFQMHTELCGVSEQTARPTAIPAKNANVPGEPSHRHTDKGPAHQRGRRAVPVRDLAVPDAGVVDRAGSDVRLQVPDRVSDSDFFSPADSANKRRAGGLQVQKTSEL